MIDTNFLPHHNFGLLVESAFKRFQSNPNQLPALPIGNAFSLVPHKIDIHKHCKFHDGNKKNPLMRSLITTQDSLIAIMSKGSDQSQRFESSFLKADVGTGMNRYLSLRNGLIERTIQFQQLNAQRLLKYALGIQTEAQPLRTKTPVLVYLFPEPLFWPEKRISRPTNLAKHRDEIQAFAKLVNGDNVKFLPLSMNDLLNSWEASGNRDVQQLALNIRDPHPPLR